MREIVRFDEVTAELQGATGGKGSTLARLHQAGYPVPDGIVILPAAFDGDQLKPSAWSQVQNHLNRMRKRDSQTAFAVRSSALSEDSAQASFAGEFETVLDVQTDEMIREAIQTVRKSRHSERVQAYTRAQGMDGFHELAVVVQRLVRADISGILFTADPVSGSRARMIGNYIYGLGDELVSGEAEPYTFTLERPKGRYEGPPEMKRFARQAYKLASRLEKDLGCPQDVEWCVSDGKLYLLQSRPITTLTEYDLATYNWNTSLTGDYLWTRQEPYPDVMTPSTWSVWRIIYGQKIAGLPSMGNVGGRLYVNSSLMYSLFRRLGRSHQDTVDYLTFLLGPLPAGVDIPTVPMSIKEILATAHIKDLLRERRLKKQAPAFLAAGPERCRQLSQHIQQIESGGTLIHLWQEEIRPLLWDHYLLISASNDDCLSPYTKLKKELTELLGDTEATVFIATMSGGTEDSASLGVTDIETIPVTLEEIFLAYYGKGNGGTHV